MNKKTFANISFLFILCFVLMSCSDSATGNAVNEEDDEVSTLTQLIEQKDAILAQKDSLVADAKALADSAQEKIESMQKELEEKQKFIDQQKIILKNFDNERAQAVADAEGCVDRIEELEEKNRKLSEIVAICQEELQE